MACENCRKAIADEKRYSITVQVSDKKDDNVDLKYCGTCLKTFWSDYAKSTDMQRSEINKKFRQIAKEKREKEAEVQNGKR